MGPVAFMVLAFPGESLTADAVAPLSLLRRSGEVRLIDSLVVTKSPEGETDTAELTEFTELADVLTGHVELNLIGPEDAEEAAAGLDPGSCASLLLIEHVWAADAAEHVTEARAAYAAAVAAVPDRS
ncbi:DUF6325 family protein [Streptomyces sp. NPDC087300]|uniref:DUF6325 family protein n=1 Tax=Streptomyces sp. NPDC087300 TaxID=3365780 RepID=UPI0038238E48